MDHAISQPTQHVLQLLLTFLSLTLASLISKSLFTLQIGSPSVSIHRNFAILDIIFCVHTNGQRIAIITQILNTRAIVTKPTDYFN
jgi:hypothetical protein